jgi:alpha-beta hydrolase superfamily lysophospholipase
MTPCFFGSRARRLFGIYESAAPGSPGKRAAVVCNPWGAEYVYAHRSLRQLALHLCAAGIHTLRFDYFGTGDSAGEMADGSLPGWEADIETAMEELQDITGAPRVALAGLRLGGSLAAKVAAQRPSNVDRLIMWAPIISGAAFVQDLVPDATDAPNEADAGVPAETPSMQGFPLTSMLRAQMQAIELTPLLEASPVPSLLLVPDGTPEPAVAPQAVGRLEIAITNGPMPWTQSFSTSGLVPIAAIQKITRWLS